MVTLPLIAGIILCGQILITTNNLDVLLLSAAALACVVLVLWLHFCPLLA
jgi:hypothetical protein